MKNLKDTVTKDFEYIGDNLKTIREELMKEFSSENKGAKENKYALTQIADDLGINYHTMRNIERGRSIASSTIKLILYYYNLGYNIEWVLLEENDFIPKKNLGENLVYKKQVQEDFVNLEKGLNRLIKEFKSKI